MKSKYKNIFFIFGIIVLVIMASQLDYNQVCEGISNAGYWFAAVIALWAALYIINTWTWYLIIRSTGDTKNVKFGWLYRITVSGFALNYATPGGLLGGEPYKIMALTPKIGAERASSSVILFAMTHIFSHFWFWLLSVVLFIIAHNINMVTGTVLAATSLFCLAGIMFFVKGYKKGLAVKAMNICRHIPGIKNKAAMFIDKNKDSLAEIDSQIAALHNQSRTTFVTAVMSELICRILSALEIYFIVRILTPDITYIDSILILAFTSLFANLLFFLPLQLGGREGGFMLSGSGLAIPTPTTIFVALIVRLRELIWTAIGLLLIKIKD